MFPELLIKKIRLFAPIRYILSGGLTYRQLVPGFMYPFIKFIEVCLTPAYRWCAYFQTIVLEKTERNI
ncbi:MAG: hypothetical protein HQL21_09895 [Candidatus Omnitrophica bacterium]|nr:hypothetical protein [Candidatus Omnitrophota bacterium]